VNTVKGYAAHERAVFESVTKLRTDAMAEHGPPDAQAPLEQALGQGVAQLLAVAEGYPDLKASQHFLALQQEIVDTEDRIQVSRRIYNANVRAYDSLVQTFPSLLIAPVSTSRSAVAVARGSVVRRGRVGLLNTLRTGGSTAGRARTFSTRMKTLFHGSRTVVRSPATSACR
jgi:hypothetical protein